jgi:hypothetical protein
MSDSHGSLADEPYVHHAWVDESIIYGSVGRYILAAVIADPLGCDAMRDQLVAMRLGRRPRLHWYQEGSKKRDEVMRAIAGFDIDAVVVVGSPVDPKKQERARRLCMKRLLHRLDELEVSQVAIESRTESLDRRDLALIEMLRGSIGLSGRLRVATVDPINEPMLWTADVIAGAVNASLVLTDEWLAMVEDVVQRIDFKLR